MPQKKAAFKQLRKSKRKHLRNVSVISKTKTFIKKFNALISEKKFDEARAFLKTVHSALAIAAAKGVMHKNTASRKISRLAKKLAKAAPRAK